MKRLLAVIVLGISATAGAATNASVDLNRDRANAEDAASIMNADRNYLELQVQRVRDLNASWQHEIALGHTHEAGILAVEHWKALQAERYARFMWSQASNDYLGAKEKLVVDEFQIQHV